MSMVKMTVLFHNYIVDTHLADMVIFLFLAFHHIIYIKLPLNQELLHHCPTTVLDG